jgi:hypothetical protein
MCRNLGVAGHNKTELEAIASKLDPWKGTDEPVHGYWKKKTSGKGRRFICEFGIEHRALQYLVREVLIALLDLHPNQYATRGGVHAAIRHTKQTLTDGYVWAAELDINNCYSSFDEEKLSSLLPLPKEVTDHVILLRYMNLTTRFNRIDDSRGDGREGDFVTPGATSPARQGLPQGSAVSPIVAEAMIAIALKAVPTLEGVIIAYADNILLLAKTKSDRDSMTKALLAAFEAHPVGRLRLSLKTFALGGPIDFLGHRLTSCEGSVRIEPDDDNRQKFERRVASELRSLAKTKLLGARWERFDRLKEYIRSWTESFKLCDDINKTRSDWLARAQAQSKEAPKPGSEEKKPRSDITYKTFKLHSDQKEIVEAALSLAKQKGGTTVDSVGLEYIAQQFMGTGMNFPTLKAAMLAEHRKAGSYEDFLANLAGLVDEIVTDLDVTISFEPKA